MFSDCERAVLCIQWAALFLYRPTKGSHMADDKTKLVADSRRIDVSEDYELRYWMKRFGVSKAHLKAAVRKVGTNAEDVAIELGKPW